MMIVTRQVYRRRAICQQKKMMSSNNSRYCFDPSVLETNVFNVDEFISDCIKRESLQKVHDDLERYLHQLEQQVRAFQTKSHIDQSFGSWWQSLIEIMQTSFSFLPN